MLFDLYSRSPYQGALPPLTPARAREAQMQPHNKENKENSVNFFGGKIDG